MPPSRTALRAIEFLLPLAVWLALPAPARALSASFEFRPAAPLTIETVTFTSTSTGVVEPQSWDLDGDGACDDATGPVARRSFPVAGAYSVKLCVSDGVDEAVLTRRVTVANRPPVASFTFSPAAPVAGDRIVLISTSSDPDGPLGNLAWDLDGDGMFDDASGPAASISFPTPGVRTVGLQASDGSGATAVAVVMIAVAERPLDLLASFSVVRLSGQVTRRGTRVRALTVDAPRGSRVRVHCRGRGCPFRAVTKVAARSRLMTVHRLHGRLLRPGAVVRVWITRAGSLGKYVRFRIRRAGPPGRADRCVRPGSRRPFRCPVPTGRSGAR